MQEEIREYIKSLLPELTAFRRELHMHPEIGLHEYETTERIKNKLLEHGIESEYIHDGVGLHLMVEGELPGDTILLRADIDALPMDEQTELPFKSHTPGLMHSCGHDMHTTFLLGTILTLTKFKHHLRGRVKCVFQSGEEMLKGAKVALDAGILKGVNAKYGFAFHVTNDVKVGMVKISRGPAMAASDTLRIKVVGKGGHAASPQATIDPIVISAHVIVGLQTLVARQKHPAEPLVITVGKIAGGTVANVTPGVVECEATVRSFSQELRAQLPQKIERVCRMTAQAYGGDCEVVYEAGCPALVSEERMFTEVRSVLSGMLGEEQVFIAKMPGMGSEDFAFYTEYMPGMQIGIGTQFDCPESTLPVHNPKVVFGEDAIFNGVLTGCTLGFELT